MSISIVQTQANYGYSSPSAAAFGSNTTTGNLITVLILSDSGSTPSISDSQSNTYTIDASMTLTSKNCFIASAKNITGGSCTVTITQSGSPGNLLAYMYETSGCDTTSPLDQTATASVPYDGYTDRNPSLTTGSTTVADEISFSIITNVAGSNSSSAIGGGYTSDTEIYGPWAVFLHKILTATGTTSPGATMNNNASWVMACCTYKIQAAGGSPTAGLMGLF